MREAIGLAVCGAVLIAAVGCGAPSLFDSAGATVESPGSSATAVAFEVDNAVTSWGQNVYVVGELPELGSWDPAHAVALSSARYPTWSGIVLLARRRQVQFKFIIRDDAGNVTWEPGANRSVAVPRTDRWAYTGSWGDTTWGSQGQLSGPAVSIHTALGVPDALTASDPNNLSHYLSVKPQYVLSYDADTKTPNWVSWELNATYLGTSGRANDFRPDDTLPPSIPQAALSDYSHSGYQRGHMCPSADRTLDDADNEATFYLTNMVPQASRNNEGPWADLEAYLRNIARDGRELYVLAGGLHNPDVQMTIGDGGVEVPSATWKVAAILDSPGEGPSSVSASTRVIAVIVPNDDSSIAPDAGWRDFRVSVRQVEQATGLDFFPDVPSAIQDAIETQVDAQ